MEVALEAELRATICVAIRRISTLIPAQRLRRASHACVSPWWQQAVTTVVNCSNHLTRSSSVLKFDACSTSSSSPCHPLEAEAEVEVEVEAKLEAEVEAEAELEADVEVEAEAELEAKLEAEVEVEVGHRWLSRWLSRWGFASTPGCATTRWCFASTPGCATTSSSLARRLVDLAILLYAASSRGCTHGSTLFGL